VTPPTAYDEVLYPSSCFEQTHPDRLATLAVLFGMEPAPVEHCRVLELGCGDGSNLLPMAFNLPKSEFVGIDLAQRPIALGQAWVEQLDIKNLRLVQGDLREISGEWGWFDYIIAHGLYAWAPAEIQDKLLAVCHAHLKPHGVAFVSYNAMPGGHLRLMLREMMLFHAGAIKDPQTRIQQARALLGFLAEAGDDDDSYRQLLQKELKRIREFPPSHFFHDDLSPIQAPCYFHQFIEQASRHKLQFLAEADYFEMHGQSFPAPVLARLQTLQENVLLHEQYLDFLKCRRFRQTLLCHADLPLERGQPGSRIAEQYIAASFQPLSAAPDLRADRIESFKSAQGVTVQTDDPLAKAALIGMGRLWPQILPVKQAWTDAMSLLDAAGVAVANREAGLADLCDFLHRLYATNSLELHAYQPPLTHVAGERPLASALVRWQNQNWSWVTNQRHRPVQVESALGKFVLNLLDGSHNRENLLREIGHAIQSGVLSPQDPSSSPPDPATLAADLDQQLQALAQHSLLLA
jgi:methyltransferase-like protein/ubiquinone/menaquinone biosynthesis C-methylase UbiE